MRTHPDFLLISNDAAKLKKLVALQDSEASEQRNKSTGKKKHNSTNTNKEHEALNAKSLRCDEYVPYHILSCCILQSPTFTKT